MDLAKLEGLEAAYNCVNDLRNKALYPQAKFALDMSLGKIKELMQQERKGNHV